MKKLSQANPELTYSQRKELMESFIPEHLQTESEIAQFFEGGEQAVAAYIQQVTDQFCSRQIYNWA